MNVNSTPEAQSPISLTDRQNTSGEICKIIDLFPDNPAMERSDRLEQKKSEYPTLTRLRNEDHRPIYCALQEVDSTLERTQSLAKLVLKDTPADFALRLDLEHILEATRRVSRSILAQPNLVSQEDNLVVVSVSNIEKDEPAWMAEVRALRANGTIPDYHGRVEDGDAYAFYIHHYSAWLHVMNQKLLKRVNSDNKLSRGLIYSASKLDKPLNDLVPSVRTKR